MSMVVACLCSAAAPLGGLLLSMVTDDLLNDLADLLFD